MIPDKNFETMIAVMPSDLFEVAFFFQNFKLITTLIGLDYTFEAS